MYNVLQDYIDNGVFPVMYNVLQDYIDNGIFPDMYNVLQDYIDNGFFPSKHIGKHYIDMKVSICLGGE